MTDQPDEPEAPDEDPGDTPPQIPMPGEADPEDEPGGDDELESSDPVRPDPNG